jgi:serine/threonine protein kinase
VTLRFNFYDAPIISFHCFASLVSVTYGGFSSTMQKKKKKKSVLYVLQEWVAGGSLGGIVRAFGPLEQQVCRRYATGVTEGLAFLHSQQIVHRDLKPDNV